MGEDNILSGGIEILFTIKESLLELDGHKQKTTELEAEEDHLEQLILTKEKVIAEEITATLNARQEEVASSFDGQIDQKRMRLKKVKQKRDKQKNMKISERMEEETADLTKEKRKLLMEIKAVFKLNQIPRIWNNKLFFSLFMPGELSDFLTLFFVILVSLAAPVGIYSFIPSTSRKSWQLFLLYLLILGILICLFLLIHKKVKGTQEAALKEIRLIRNKLARNKKNINRVKRNIAKDEDESNYGLEKYDEEIKELEQQMTQIIEQKKEAIEGFESKTKKMITEEIRSRYAQELEQLKQKHTIAYEAYRKSEEKAKNFVLEISKRYEAFLGKDFMSLVMIDSLISIMENQEMKTISEALTYYKNMSAGTQHET